MTAYEMRISDWSSDVCSSDLNSRRHLVPCECMPTRGLAEPDLQSRKPTDLFRTRRARYPREQLTVYRRRQNLLEQKFVAIRVCGRRAFGSADRKSVV